MTILTVYFVVFVTLIVALVFLWLNAFRHLFLEQYRQRLFRIRDDLFNAAHSGEISFDDPGYHALRYMINGMVRYAHKTSATSFALMYFWPRFVFGTEDIYKFSDPDLERVAEQHPELYRELSNKIAVATIEHFINCSLFLRVCVWVLWRRQRIISRAANRIQPMVDDVGLTGARRAGLPI